MAFFNAAERQGDKAWGFQPQVIGNIEVCALKGRGKLICRPFQRPFRAHKLTTT
ncbi:MAG: hypothetical protein GY795_32495 [Desulfobacterales bacterium]|nr:hypothetical protein [Desulfobacterales bacterium]